MKLRHSLIIACVVVGWQTIASGQDSSSSGQNQSSPSQSQTSPSQVSPTPSGQNPQNATVQSSGSDSGVIRNAPAAPLTGIVGMDSDVGTEDSNNILPQIPSLLGGQGISSFFVSSLERSNYLRGGINVGAAYDDNPLLLSDGAVGNGSVSIFPNISIEQSSTRMRWKLGYAGGLTINQRFTNQDEGSHNLNFDSQYRLSPHLNLRVAEVFSVTTGFFDSGNGAETVVGSGAPNVSLIAPLSTQRSSLTTVETNYHFALNDLVGASGSFYDLHYTNVPQATGLETTLLTDSETATGSAFWLHRIFGGNWAGASYRFERLTFTGGDETLVHSFLAVDTMKLAQRFMLSGYAGPQYAENQGFVAGGSGTTFEQLNQWSFAGGVDGGWQNLRTGLFAGYSRSISDGGGILGAVRLQSVHGSFRRELVPGWMATVSAVHGSNQALLVTDGYASSINLTSAGVGLERNVGKSVGLHLGYSHDFQQQYFLPAGSSALDASKNRFFITLSYQWAKPLGM